MKKACERVRWFHWLMASVWLAGQSVAAEDQHWVCTWGCGLQLTEPGNVPPAPGLAGNTLRQVVQATTGGNRLRVKFSNAYGTNAVVLNSVHLALNDSPTATSAVDPATDRELAFNGAPSAIIPAGQDLWSDPLDFHLPPLAKVSLTIYFGAASGKITGHPGSRTTSYLLPGNAAAATNLTGAVRTVHWYHLAALDVLAGSASKALVTLGDSITDGRGSTTDGNNRWPDDLARRLHTNSPTASVAVVNMGIGGNGVFGGLGPPATRRFGRDVLDPSGVRWVIIFEGVNDIGGGKAPAIAANLIAAYQQFSAQAQAQNIRVYGATITPFGGSGYDSEGHEAARQTVNTWIRTNQVADAVIDFDAVVRDPSKPGRLKPAYDSGDHLHLSPSGYRAMADAIDLNLFTR